MGIIQSSLLDDEQQPITQEEHFSKLQRISRSDPSPAQTLLRPWSHEDGIVRRNVASSKYFPSENYSKRDEDVERLIKSLLGLECTLASTSVNEGIVFDCASSENSSNNINAGKRGEKQEEKGGRRRQKRLAKTVNNNTVEKARRIKHYSSSHRILLVGEGDFSFSACLAKAFGNASNMIATSRNKRGFLMENYQNAMSNVEELTSRGCKVMHGIDATQMANHAALENLKFDRIVFNFPFAGFFKKLPADYALHRHRSLVREFLMNAKEMISEDGEIHISHKTNGVHKEWDLEGIASSNGLRLVEAVDFRLGHYPGYNTKSGFGGDNNFNCYPSKTFKFGLNKMITD